jgi:hypothetical protein
LFRKSLIHCYESWNNIISLFFFFCIYLIRFELCFTELIKSLKTPIKSTILHRINILFVLIKNLNQVRIWSPSFLVWFVRQAWAKKLWSFESPSFIKVDGSLKKLAWRTKSVPKISRWICTWVSFTVHVGNPAFVKCDAKEQH